MELLGFKPKYITFDCYGTLTNFQMNDTVRPLIDGVIPPERADEFLKDFRAYRIDEVLGEFKLYPFVLRDSWQREILHVSSHIWYDVIPAHELGIKHKVYVNRGYDPSTPYYEYAETTDLTGVPDLLGL
jgi:FMN phosphatase YigB (HAD superfamily)